MHLNAAVSRGELVDLFVAHGDAKAVARRARVHREGDPLTHGIYITDGWIGRFRSGASGVEAFTGLFMAGDVVGIDALDDAARFDELAALTDATVLRLPLAHLRRAVETGGPAALEIARRLAMDSAFLREAMIAIGTQSSAQKIATFMLQTFERLRTAALIGPDALRFALPLTQANLGAMTGLTSVHVNRVLRRLRADGLLEVGGGSVRIVDLVRLRAVARGDH